VSSVNVRATVITAAIYADHQGGNAKSIYIYRENTKRKESHLAGGNLGI